jgi:hypothetical protein
MLTARQTCADRKRGRDLPRKAPSSSHCTVRHGAAYQTTAGRLGARAFGAPSLHRGQRTSASATRIDAFGSRRLKVKSVYTGLAATAFFEGRDQCRNLVWIRE